MELVKGPVIGVLLGSLVTFLMALILSVSGIYLFVGEDGGWIAFRNGMILMPITIGVCVVLISVLMGLVYADKRRAVRVEREFAAIAGNQ